jgi:hypothetical protein
MITLSAQLAMAANASMDASYTNEGVLAYIWQSGPPAPTSQDFYEGMLTRLQRLLGDTLRCVRNH